MPERNLSRDDLKAAILWCARMWVSFTGQPFSGPLRVSVHKTDEKEANIVKPMRTLDGMERPDWFALEEVAADVASASELLRVLLSPDEEKLMADLVKHQPCSATSVQDRCKQVIGKSEFWAVWGQLQGRMLIEEGDDKRYSVGPEWLAAWLREKGGAGKVTAA